MFRWALQKEIDKLEREWNGDASYRLPDVALVWNSRARRLRTMLATDAYREAIVKRWGRRARVSVSFAITAARIDSTLEHALGHGKACMRVVAGAMFDHSRGPALGMPRLRSSEGGPADVAVVRTA
jgi:hypothetical protein